MRRSIAEPGAVPALMLCLLLFAGAPAAATLEVLNNSDSSITELYVSPISCDTWGGNLLEADLAPGESLELVIPSGGYDLKAVTSVSGVQVEWGISICQSYSWEVTSEEPYIPITGGG